MLNWVRKARIFTTMDIVIAYHNMSVTEGDHDLTAVGIDYQDFQCWV
jgi:hypothetical protein